MSTTATFPCAVCASPLEVRKDKKGKPYAICDSCGMQMFVRYGVGINKFRTLLADVKDRDIWTRLERLEKRYKKQCPECGGEFWIEERLRKTSIQDASLQSYRCPKPGCKGVVKPDGAK